MNILDEVVEPAGAAGRPGNFEVQEIESLDVSDERREKVLPLLVHAPREKGRHPIILFSHGVGVSPKVTAELTRFWASHGYVCLSPVHDDAPESRARRGEELVWDRDAGNPGRFHGNMGRLDQLLRDPKTPRERVADLVTVLDFLPALERQAPELQAKLDRDKIGAAGHSYGAFISQLVGGAPIKLPGGTELTDMSDSRISAVLQLGGQASSGRYGVTKDSWRNFENPMLIVTADADPFVPDVRSDWMKEGFLLSPAGGKFYAIVLGGNHSALGCLDFDEAYDDLTKRNARLIAPYIQGVLRAKFRQQFARTVNCVKALTITFWDAYLKCDAEQTDRLHSKDLDTQLTNQIEILSR